MGKVMLGA